MKKEIEKRWLTEFDEINRLMDTSYLQAAEQVDKKKQIEDDMLAFFILAYQRGYRDVEAMTGQLASYNLTEMQNAIYTAVEDKTWVDRADEYINADDLTGLEMLAETEYHRIYNLASSDAGGKIQDQFPDLELVKTWHTMEDDKVRETHRYLDNMSISETAEFYTIDGDHALGPGNFAKAENNVNCRCILDHHFQLELP